MKGWLTSPFSTKMIVCGFQGGGYTRWFLWLCVFFYMLLLKRAWCSIILIRQMKAPCCLCCSALDFNCFHHYSLYLEFVIKHILQTTTPVWLIAASGCSIWYQPIYCKRLIAMNKYQLRAFMLTRYFLFLQKEWRDRRDEFKKKVSRCVRRSQEMLWTRRMFRPHHWDYHFGWTGYVCQLTSESCWKVSLLILIVFW